MLVRALTRFAFAALVTGTLCSVSAALPAQAATLSLQVSGNQLLDATGAPVQLRGVNRSGTEYGCVQGYGPFDGPSDAASVQAIASWHVNIVRVLVNEDCWLGINGAPNGGYSAATYQQDIVDYVNLLHQYGMYAEVSLIWAAPGTNLATDQPGSPDEDHSPAMWAGMAAAFKADPAVILAPWGETIVDAACFLNGGVCEATYGSSNTPYNTAGMQQAVSVMRNAGFTGPIAVPCLSYANDCTQWLSYEPADPLNQLVAEAHIYGKQTCSDPTCFNSQLLPVAQAVPMIWGEAGETYDASDCGSSIASVNFPWAMAHTAGLEAWTWDTWGTCDALIANYNGSYYSGYGQWVQSYYAQLSSVPPPTVSGLSLSSGPVAGGTAITISGTNLTAATSVTFGGVLASSFTVQSATSIAATTPAHCPGTVDVRVTTSGGTSIVVSADRFTFNGGQCAAVSRLQYRLAGSDGVHWQDLDSGRLSLTLTPAANSLAVLGGNADLWTANAGYNQDLAITVNGSVAAWKESGGFAGTFSPNAAFVQTVIPMTAGATYIIKLQWKTNIPEGAATIFAGAGGPAPYSPTTLTASLTPSSAGLQSAVSNLQYRLAGSDGVTWTDLDTSSATPLSLSWTPTASVTAVLGGNADLWTANAGVNQDLAITVNGTVVAWKESGGFAGTFSPNAAFVQAAIPVTAGTLYTIKLQWKTNIPTGGTIFAGAGGGSPYSPTRLTVQFFSGGTGLTDVVTSQQYHLSGSNGASWSDLDATHLSLLIAAQPAGCLALLSGNADLWTANAGYNQDLAIAVNGSVVAWKESGGFAGTFSPNAAFVQTLISLVPSASTTVKLQWKPNKPEPTSAEIFAGAGPWPAGSSSFSPTRLTAAVYCS